MSTSLQQLFRNSDSLRFLNTSTSLYVWNFAVMSLGFIVTSQSKRPAGTNISPSLIVSIQISLTISMSWISDCFTVQLINLQHPVIIQPSMVECFISTSPLRSAYFTLLSLTIALPHILTSNNALSSETYTTAQSVIEESRITLSSILRSALSLTVVLIIFVILSLFFSDLYF